MGRTTCLNTAYIYIITSHMDIRLGQMEGGGAGCLFGLGLSLYSTRMQNTWRRGLALGNAPNARILRWGYQHVGILQPTQTLASGVKTLA